MPLKLLPWPCQPWWGFLSIILVVLCRIFLYQYAVKMYQAYQAYIQYIKHLGRLVMSEYLSRAIDTKWWTFTALNVRLLYSKVTLRSWQAIILSAIICQPYFSRILHFPRPWRWPGVAKLRARNNWQEQWFNLVFNFWLEKWVSLAFHFCQWFSLVCASDCVCLNPLLLKIASSQTKAYLHST